MSWSDSDAAMLRIDGCSRSPLLYSCNALTMYSACWPPRRGTEYTSGNAVRQSGMPWQPSHIRVFSLPRAALPACGAGACAQASAAAHENSAAVVSCLIIRCRSGGSVNGWWIGKRAGCRARRAKLRNVEKPSNSMRCAVAGSMRAVSALEKLHLLANILPVVGVGRRGLALDDRLPQLRKLGS